MTLSTRPTVLLAACALVACTTLAAGCTASGTQQPAEKPAATAPVEESVKAMSPEQKRAVMAEGFPIEVPVPQGQVTRAQAQGGDAWDYEIKVAASPEALVGWFVNTYTGRSWTVVGQGPLTEGAGGSYLELRKNAAESRVDILSGAEGGTTVVRVTVGVGAPVLGTY